MNRPDFREIGRLIDSLRALDADFQKIFADRTEQEEELKACCTGIRRTQSVGQLDGIPVEELRNARAGIRTAALEQAGFQSLGDLYRAGDWRLQGIDGIGEKQSAAIRGILDEFLNRLAQSGRIRLEESEADCRRLILLLARFRQADLIRRDAEPLREELHAEVEAKSAGIKIHSRLGWLFSGRIKKEDTIFAAGELLLLARSTLCRRAERLTALYREVLQIDEETALAEYRRNSAPFYALLESLTGASAPQEMIYSSIPAQLAAQIDAAELDLRAFKGSLRAYQAFGTRYILTQKRVLLGDEMGLGKTIQAIAAMAHLHSTEDRTGEEGKTDGSGSAGKPSPRFLIVCPASVMINWCREITKFSDVEPHLLHGPSMRQSLDRWEQRGGAAVTNYESMEKVAPRVDKKLRLEMLVIDEAHYIKNPEAKRTRLIHSLEEESERIVLMTGTPLENRVMEMCALIDFVRPDLADGIRVNAAIRHIPAFREMLAPVYLRRQRDQVLEELPPCTEEDEWCLMTPQDLITYSACVKTGDFNGMRRISFLQEDLHTSSKAARLLELCAQAGDEGRKIVIYSFFRETIRKLESYLRENICLPEGQKKTEGQDKTEKRNITEEQNKAEKRNITEEQNKAEGQDKTEERDITDERNKTEGRSKTEAGGSADKFLGLITGSTPAADRQGIVDRFSDAPAGSILLCQVQAGGTGLNIQSAGVVIFCEPQIKPSLTQQAIARVYRMGQVRSVLVYHLLCESTVDEAVRRLLEEKQAEFDQFADESALADAADGLLDREWIRQFLEEEHRRYLPAVTG